MAFRRPRLGAPPPPTPDPGQRRGFLAAAAGLLAGGALLARPRSARAATQSSDPFIGELMLFAGNFAPVGWAFCDGSLVSIAQNTALFSLLGTQYGGDGVSTFALPDLRGRCPVSQGTSPNGSPYFMGQSSGQENVALSTPQLPLHSHLAVADAAPGTSSDPSGALPARNAAGDTRYGAGTGSTQAATHIAASGGVAAHGNMPPFLSLTYCISLYGIYPARG